MGATYCGVQELWSGCILGDGCTSPSLILQCAAINFRVVVKENNAEPNATANPSPSRPDGGHDDLMPAMTESVAN